MCVFLFVFLPFFHFPPSSFSIVSLNTILDADRIMVFDGGKLVEYDSPKKLLSDSRGYLSWLVAETNSAGKLHQQQHH